MIFRTLLFTLFFSFSATTFSQNDTLRVETKKHGKVINDVGRFGKKILFKIKEIFAVKHRAPKDYVEMESIQLLSKDEFENIQFSSNKSPELGLKLLYPRITPNKGFFSFQLGDYEYYKYIKDIDLKDVEYIKLIAEDGSECYIDKFNFVKRNSQSRHFSFLLDHSGSMGRKRASQLQSAIYHAIENNFKVDKNANYNIYKFSEYNKLISKGNDLNTIKRALIPTNGLKNFGGGTAVKDALLKSVTDLISVDKDEFKLIVIFTDGDSNSDLSQMPMKNIVKMANDNNINIVSVAFGSYLNVAYLQDISTFSGGNLYHIYNPEEFLVLFDNIFKDVNVSYDIEFAPCMFGNEIKLEMKLINNDKPLIGSTVFRTPIAEGYSIDLNILFDKGSYKLKQAYREKLEVIITLMKLNPSLEIIIEGHSDRLGTENVNLKLSKSRANEVKKFITSKNINEKRIKTVGYGSSRPLFEYAENSNENSFNRRIQIVVSKP